MGTGGDLGGPASVAGVLGVGWETQSRDYLLLEMEAFQYLNTAMALAFSVMFQPYTAGLGCTGQRTERICAAVLGAGLWRGDLGTVG